MTFAIKETYPNHTPLLATLAEMFNDGIQDVVSDSEFSNKTKQAVDLNIIHVSEAKREEFQLGQNFDQKIFDHQLASLHFSDIVYDSSLSNIQQFERYNNFQSFLCEARKHILADKGIAVKEFHMTKPDEKAMIESFCMTPERAKKEFEPKPFPYYTYTMWFD